MLNPGAIAMDVDSKRAGLEPAAVGAVDQQQTVLNDDGHPKRDQQWRQDVVTEDAFEHQPLQRKAHRKHHHDDQQRRGDQRNTQHRGHTQHQIGREQDQITMGKIDEPHDAEDQRQPERKQRIDAAE